MTDMKLVFCGKAVSVPKTIFGKPKRLASLLCKLDRNGQKGVYEYVLMREYSTLEAIEREPRPEEAGYYLPHHAVIRREAVTTKVSSV